MFFGVQIRRKEDLRILALVEQEAVDLLEDNREELRDLAKENLCKVQEENRRNHNRDSKKATDYTKGDLVAIKRTHFDPGFKIKRKFLGPYKVSQVNGNKRYEVIRVGKGEGPKIKSTAADYMKLYNPDFSEAEN